MVNSVTLTAFAVLSTLSAAHINIVNPAPFVFQDPGTKRSPLKNVAIGSPGSDFPCKKVNGQKLQADPTAPKTSIAIGQTNYLTFFAGDTATHGGGSCQLSITKDADPTPDSVWKVVHTFEGGCPVSTKGNADEPGNPKPSPLPWQMPSGVPSGDYTFAWTWMPRLSGGPEFYMNCAPISVTGSDTKDDAALDALPNMFVANLEGQDCKRTGNGGGAFKIPNPGEVTTNSDYPFDDGEGAGCSKLAADTRGGSSSGGSGTSPAPPAQPPKQSASAPAPSAPATTVSTSTRPKPTGNGIDLGPNRGKLPAPVTSAVPSPDAPIQGGSPAAPTGAVPGPAPGAGGANTTCNNDGRIVCNGVGQFGICNWGKVDVWINVSAGTECKDGDVVAIESPKVRRHLARHARKMHRQLS